MRRLFRFVLLLLLVYLIISCIKILGMSRLVIMGILFVFLIGAIIWVVTKALKKPR